MKFMTSTGSHELDMRQAKRTRATCVDLISHIRGFHHILYTDSYYTSYDMVTHLLDHHSTYVVGSLRQDRRGFPTALRTNLRRNPDSERIRTLQRGQFQSRQKGEVVTVVWKDSNLLSLMTSCMEGFREGDVRVVRFIRNPETGKKVPYSLPAPRVVDEYNCFTGGVDRANQIRSYYSSQRQAHKWWKYLFYYLLDTALANSWIIYKELVNKKKSHKDFQVAVGQALVGGHTVQAENGDCPIQSHPS